MPEHIQETSSHSRYINLSKCILEIQWLNENQNTECACRYLKLGESWVILLFWASCLGYLYNQLRHYSIWNCTSLRESPLSVIVWKCFCLLAGMWKRNLAKINELRDWIPFQVPKEVWAFQNLEFNCLNTEPNCICHALGNIINIAQDLQ